MQEGGGLSFVLFCGAGAGSLARGSRSLVFTFNCSMYPWKRSRTGSRVPWRGHMAVFVYVHSTVVFHFEKGLGFSQAFLPDQGFKNTSVQ